ncbi:glycine cleavage system protein H [Carnobacterium gallinarum]|uniref:glycine cleavage system protein H n=1 Tax=Carnobacterium gallinarum TaxID=2749 RepID=UPI00055441D7|nr:glycine cleavage system protein H [Carnobacterium gallinarum]
MTVRYSENGLWVEKISEGYKIGLSAKGQDDLGEVMFVDITPETTVVAKDDTLIGVEASKAVTELTAPFKGTVLTWHTALSENPEFLNSTDSKENWIVVLTDVSETEFTNLATTEEF